MGKKVVIVAAKRTAIGKFCGTLASIAAMDLGATVIKSILAETQVNPAELDEVIMGHALTAGLGQNTVRQAALTAGLPYEVSCFGINLVCGSGLQAVNLAAQAIASGNAEIIIAGGQESMTRAPFLLEEMRSGKRMGDTKVIDSMIHDGLTDAYHGYHMGVTAENVAAKYNISRSQQDEFALSSQTKATLAQQSGKFKDEIVTVEIRDKKNNVNLFDADEFIRPNSTLESITKAKPVFIKDGTVTAANSSGINDGAAAVLLMSEAKAQEYGLEVLASVEAYATSGCDPAIMGIGPVVAIQKTLRKTNWDLAAIDLFELNEAFAAQSLAVIQQLNLTAELMKINVNGGAIALGHPIGASGCRILVTLLHEMKRRQVSKGLASLCIGGGMGVALAVSRNN